MAGERSTDRGAVRPRAPAVASAAWGGGADGSGRDLTRGDAGTRKSEQAMSLNGTVWAPIGPSPMNENGSEDNGLVTAIAVNPNNTNVLYLGTGERPGL